MVLLGWLHHFQQLKHNPFVMLSNDCYNRHRFRDLHLIPRPAIAVWRRSWEDASFLSVSTLLTSTNASSQVLPLEPMYQTQHKCLKVADAFAWGWQRALCHSTLPGEVCEWKVILTVKELERQWSGWDLQGWRRRKTSVGNQGIDKNKKIRVKERAEAKRIFTAKRTRK